METKTVCSHCGASMAISDDKIGSSIRCPKCLEKFVASESDTPQPIEELPAMYDLERIERRLNWCIGFMAFQAAAIALWTFLVLSNHVYSTRVLEQFRQEINDTLRRM